MKLPASRLSNTGLVLFIFLTLFIPGSCKKDNVAPADKTQEASFNLDKGGTGLIMDTREIYRKGYKAVRAEIHFNNYPDFDESVVIDSLTCLAVYEVETKNLTDAQKSAFNDGVSATIDIYDNSGMLLTTYSDNKLELDDSNRPLQLTTDKDYIVRPLNLKEGEPYLLQMENSVGVITSTASDGFLVQDYVNDSPDQQFYFNYAGAENTYTIDHYGYGEGTHMALEPTYQFIILAGNAVPLPTGEPTKFIFEQDPEGWVSIRVANTNKYLYLRDSKGYEILADSTGNVSRFRFISDNIKWKVEDRGTHYDQPIMSPVKLDFAYKARLKNCSSASLSEQVGKTESKSRTTTMGTSESLQLFSSETDKIGLKAGLSVSAKVGADVEGVGEASEEVTVSEEVSTEFTYTTSETTTSENTWSESTTTTDEVSRVRTLELLPYTAVDVYDAIKSVDNVVTPFIQTLRISGNYKKSGQALTGPELVTQMQFNFVSGIISDIEKDYIEVTIRGHAIMDQLFNATTEVNEVPGACDN
jgi:hypothetical protein